MSVIYVKCCLVQNLLSGHIDTHTYTADDRSTWTTEVVGNKVSKERMKHD